VVSGKREGAHLVTLSAAKGLDSMLKRFFAALRMTKGSPAEIKARRRLTVYYVTSTLRWESTGYNS
jgi:hypothetical protein